MIPKQGVPNSIEVDHTMLLQQGQKSGNDAEDNNDVDFNDEEYNVYDDDDLLYVQNVTEGIELGMAVPTIDENENEIVSESSSYGSSEELNHYNSSDSEDEDVAKFPEFFAETDMKNPHMEEGKLFGSFQEFKEALKNHALMNNFEPRVKKSDKTRCQFECKKDCTWRIWASKMQGTDTVQIKSYKPNHTCIRSRTNRHATYKWLANHYLDGFKADPDWKTKLFRAIVKKDFGIEVTKRVVWNARKYAKELLEGKDAEQFALLGKYGVELKRTNPGSTVIIAQRESIFKGIYVCIDACKRGFLQACRRVVGVDGCHLKGKYGGVLLAAVGLDGNDCIYPIAYAIVEKEDTSSWRWFLMLLSEDLSLDNWYSVTFMSDKQKGLVNVLFELFPEAEHRFYVRHLYQNFFKADSKFRGKLLKDRLWGAAKASNLAAFKYWMNKIQSVNEDAYDWLMKRSPKEWSRSEFSTLPKCDILLNNLCECFNKFILEEKELSIIDMLISIQMKLMERFKVKREKIRGFKGTICQKIQKKLEKYSMAARECILHGNGMRQYYVECSYGAYVVDLENKTCACRRWDLTGIPCPHAIACIIDEGLEVNEYVCDWYSIETYRRAYEHAINPINGKAMWAEYEYLPTNPPPWYIPQKGRRQKKRRKGAEEIDPSQSKSIVGKKQKNVYMTCGICGEKGHNRRHHNSMKSSQNDSTKIAHEEPNEIPMSPYVPVIPSNDITNDGLQEMEVHGYDPLECQQGTTTSWFGSFMRELGGDDIGSFLKPS